MINALFGLDLSKYEEQLLAALFLRKYSSEALSSHTFVDMGEFQRMREGLRHLEALPGDVANEVALETLGC